MTSPCQYCYTFARLHKYPTSHIQLRFIGKMPNEPPKRSAQEASRTCMEEGGMRASMSLSHVSRALDQAELPGPRNHQRIKFDIEDARDRTAHLPQNVFTFLACPQGRACVERGIMGRHVHGKPRATGGAAIRTMVKAFICLGVVCMDGHQPLYREYRRHQCAGPNF